MYDDFVSVELKDKKDKTLETLKTNVLGNNRSKDTSLLAVTECQVMRFQTNKAGGEIPPTSFVFCYAHDIQSKKDD